MASSTTTTNQYAYQRPSTIATRSLISPQESNDPIPSSSSHDSGDPNKPTLQRKTTNHYEKAVAEAGKVTAPISDAQSSSSARPGLDRQQSWSMRDFKRERHEQMLAGQPVSAQGYHSTGGQ